MNHATPEGGDLRRLVNDLLAPVAPSWLESQRWFADKGRGIATVEIVDLLADGAGEEILILAIAAITFADGTDARYLLPLALTRNAEPGSAVSVSVAPQRALTDGLASPRFAGWLLALLSQQGESAAANWGFSTSPRARPVLETASRFAGSLMGAEQSNSSLRFDDALILKLFRRLQPGVNPDEEIGRALTDAGFARIPPFAGSADWTSPTGDVYPILLAQTFVANRGDGWTWMLKRLRDVASTVAPIDVRPERLLGARTGELHLALSRLPGADFQPEPATPEDAARLQREVRQEVDVALGLLEERRDTLPETMQRRLPEIASRLRGAVANAQGFAAETGVPRIRVHGDFHLGQTLRDLDDDWIFIDFEGEPARSIAERRRKSAPLRDVAGMLRSFGYARGVVERERLPGDDEESAARLAEWEERARLAFLAGYRRAVRNERLLLVPENDSAFSTALAAWELHKALYEIAYEARNRPEWLEIPLRAIP